MRAQKAMLLFGAALSASAGCQALVTLDARPSSVDASMDGGTAESAPPPLPTVNACNDGELTKPTTVALGAAAQPIELVFSYLSLDTIPPADAGVPLCEASGFSLESLPCEAADAAVDAGARCRTHCGASEKSARDNGGGELLRKVLAFPGASDIRVPEPTEAIARGSANLLVRILDYHQRVGEDDDEVHIELYGLAGLAASSQPVVDPIAPDGTFQGVDAGPWARAWDRATYREWSVEPDSFANIVSRAATYTGTGYVKGKVLVADADHLPMTFSTFGVVLDKARITGELRRDAEGHWSLVRGRLGGDLPVEQLRKRLPLLIARNPALCDSIVRPLYYGQICASLDRGPTGTTCDALSLGASFAMVEGKLGLPHFERLREVDCELTSCP